MRDQAKTNKFFNECVANYIFLLTDIQCGSHGNTALSLLDVLIRIYQFSVKVRGEKLYSLS